MKNIFAVGLFLVSSMIFQNAKADLLFEGYSKILSQGVHVGYVITRYEFDNKTKQFISTYYLRTNEMAGNITESLKAFANEDLGPISYQYTTADGSGKNKTIDATFKKDQINATLVANGKTERIIKPLPKGAFLSTFLVYLILRNKEGLKPDQKYDYQAIAEEDGQLYKGMAYVKSMEPVGAGINAYRVLNEFKDNKFVSFSNERGEVFGTQSPGLGISTELAAKPEAATAGLPVNTAILKTLFGNVPEGIYNALAKKQIEEDKKKVTAPEGKGGHVPGGAGIQIKSQEPAQDTVKPEPTQKSKKTTK